MSPSGELAVTQGRVNNVFLTQSYPDEGIFALYLYVRGRPVIVTIDDYLPYYSGNLLLARDSKYNSNYWVALLEKAYAKLNCNYENLNFGW
jgi:hypothetical protein